MKDQKIELKQREHLVSLIERAKTDERKQLEEKNGATEDSVIVELLKKGKGGLLLENIRKVENQVSALESVVRDDRNKLEGMGFDIDRSGVSLKWNAPHSLRSQVDAILEDARRPIVKSLKKYDLAIARIWTTTSSEELQKVIEGLI